MASKKIILRFRAVNRDIFDAIRDGHKRVETRAATKRYADIKSGDGIVLVCGRNKLEKLVKRAVIFKTIPALLHKYNVRDIYPHTKDFGVGVNPNTASEKELREIYYSFPGYKEKIKKYGLIAIELAS